MSRSIAALLCLLAAGEALAAPPRPRATPRSELRGEVSVREVELSVALPDDLSPFRARALGAADFIVIRDGKEQEVVRAERVLPKDRAWTQVVWIDRTLAGPDTVYETVRHLAERSADLERLGALDVVVADPRPRLELAQGQDRAAIRRALEDTAAEAARSRRAAGAPAVPPLDNAALRRQADRLVAWLTARRVVGPRVLWLPIDGVALSLPGIAAFGGHAAPDAPPLSPAERERVAILTDLERALAAYGWTTLALLDHSVTPPGATPRAEGAFDRWHDGLPKPPGPGGTGSAPLLLRFPTQRGDRTRYDPRTLDAMLDPRTAGPRLVAEETGGWMLAGPWDLAPAFDALSRRWRIWTTAAAEEGPALHPVSITLRKGPALRAARWLRSATPEIVTETRLRALLAGEAPAGGVDLAVRRAEVRDGELELEVALPEPEAGAPPPVWGFVVATQTAASDAPAFVAASAEPRGAAWIVRAALPPGARPTALAASERRSDAFAVATIPPPS